MLYQIPDRYYFRIHHVRPRFKNDVESVLMYMAESICRLPQMPQQDFKNCLNSLIYAYPGNAQSVEKTINNWRTEISALFGFFETHNGESVAGLRAKELAESGDVVSFFKTFLYLFQYPGGHIKPNRVLEQIEHRVRFKPAQYILKVFKAAEKKGIKHFTLTKAEVCHCIFNDLRATSGMEDPEDTLVRIIRNKEDHVTYDETGDVIRYAGDILDYMYIANLLRNYNGSFSLNTSEGLAISKFVNSKEWFTGYDLMISSGRGDLREIGELSEQWFSYVNKDLGDTDFATDISALLNQPGEENDDGTGAIDLARFDYEEFIKKLKLDLEMSTKSIGDVGEGIVQNHEQKKLKQKGFESLIHLVKKIPTPLGVGYDIQSFEDDGTKNKKYIEVKTTISANPLKVDRIHLTANEWNTAQTLRSAYYVYRLQITRNNLNLFVLNNPVGLYKEDKIVMTPGGDGAELQFTPLKVGRYEEVLI